MGWTILLPNTYTHKNDVIYEETQIYKSKSFKRTNLVLCRLGMGFEETRFIIDISWNAKQKAWEIKTIIGMRRLFRNDWSESEMTIIWVILFKSTFWLEKQKQMKTKTKSRKLLTHVSLRFAKYNSTLSLWCLE